MLNLKKQIPNTMNRKVHILTIIVAGSAAFWLSGCNAGQSSNGSSSFKPGNLAINSSSSSRLFESQPTVVTIALMPTDGSPVESANVSIVSNNPKILNVTPNTCVLNSVTNTCNVKLIGESLGVANFKINAPGLVGVTSENYTIIAQTPDHLSGDMPYSRDHAGVQTPVKVIFNNPVRESTIESTTFYITAPNGGHVPGSVVSGTESATFTPSTPLAYGTTYTVHTTNGIKDLNGDSVAALTESNTYTTQESYSIFVSSTAITGNLDGVDGADNTCATDTKCPLGSSCKAILATSPLATHARQANPVNNWVLEPYTAYVNEAGQIIGTTGIGAAINNSVFAFPLTNAIEDGTNNTVWTGLDELWNVGANTCSDWSAGDDSSNGNIGQAFVADSNSVFISDGTGFPSCKTTHHLYCVQVPQ